MTERYGDRYDKYTTSFSGTDMVVSFVFPERAPVIVGTATTITYSIYRQLAHVRTLGRISSKGYARGGRTCAGTIIFTIINESIIEDVRRRVDYLGEFKSLKPDELPPFDIILTSGNEFGQSSTMVIHGASIVDESKTLSIEDIFTENVFTFLARDIQHMKAGDKLVPLSGQTFRGSDENLGKFTLAELIATAEDEARKARLEEIAKAEAERWKEPVLTDPATVPSDSSGGGSSGGSTSPGTAGEGTIGIMNLTVYEESGGKSTRLQGATVWYTDNGNKITKTTDAQGQVKLNVPYGTSIKYSATKSGYAEVSKSFTVKKADGQAWGTITIHKVASKPPGGYDPSLKENVVYTSYNGPAAYRTSEGHIQTIEKIWNTDAGPMIKLKNGYGEELVGIPVKFSYVIHNSDQCPWYKKGGFRHVWPNDKGDLSQMDYSSSYGNARIPVFPLASLFDGCVIEIIAKPYTTKNTSDGLASKSLWKSWHFEKDNGGL